MMSILKAYVARAAAVNPETWKNLQAEPAKSTIQKLWKQGEDTLKQACIKDAGLTMDDGMYIQDLCNPNSNPPIAKLIGREPSCELACARKATGGSGGGQQMTFGSEESQPQAQMASSRSSEGQSSSARRGVR